MNHHFLFVCFEVGGRKPMLPEFSFKTLSQRNNEKSFRAFTAEKLLKETNEHPNEANIQKINISKILQFQQVTDTPKLFKTPKHLFLNKKGKLNTPRFDTSKDRKNENKLLQKSEITPSQTNHLSTTNSAVKNIQMKNAFLKIDNDNEYPRWQESLRVTNDEMWRNELKLDPLPSTRETHEIHAHLDSSTASTKPSTFRTDFDSGTPYTGVTVTMKSVGTPKSIQFIPYCSWIDPYKCPDVSKIQPSCIESPTIPALDGECKMCPFDWCLEPNDMAGSGKLHDHSPLDVVLNAGSKEPPKLALAINRPVTGQEQDNVNSKVVRKTTTEIPFWNFETFGP